LDSLKKKGFKKTAASATKALKINWSRMLDYAFDLQYGTDTRHIIELQDLEIKSANKSRGVRCEPTRAIPFRRLLRALNLPKDSVFVDLGCGKGRILLLACEYGFKSVKGVDFSSQLCGVARRNLATYASQRGLRGKVDVIQSDVVDYRLQDDENIFFMFNPFDGVVLERVMENIRLSLRRKKRTIWLIYYRPVWQEVIEQSKILKRLASYNYGGCEFTIYSNNPQERDQETK
jgi:SAM-dependent methyltransferase